jgi:hypothetical protein
MHKRYQSLEKRPFLRDCTLPKTKMVENEDFVHATMPKAELCFIHSKFVTSNLSEHVYLCAFISQHTRYHSILRCGAE